MIRAVIEIARHELFVALRTTRAVWVAAIYLFAAVLGGAGMIFAVRAVEDKLIEQLVKQGADLTTATASLSLMSEPAYQKLAAFFADADSEAVAASLQSSIIHPFLLWGSLAFLPFLILMTSFDQVAGDLQSRTRDP